MKKENKKVTNPKKTKLVKKIKIKEIKSATEEMPIMLPMTQPMETITLPNLAKTKKAGKQRRAAGKIKKQKMEMKKGQMKTKLTKSLKARKVPKPKTHKKAGSPKLGKISVTKKK